ncbi:uncharacterized protein AMSG_07077 [Thecamonas trahens ATCC 50062]|uniref:Uncharacterized protein n=1 Tax=Thecamonas trahens ATCC 50062 TaxID=461836 RepID=A0A0L0DIE9_THETB|nr:hypothetical protein AMSG_07077 [Thecamonas trahens ATCC 50062]KNC51088.1 hypothetical protein AMSG_07077 [Thecamonas trahens ATCC 50062]|eukprot:XP_013756542.1 hypothetical protein AMSG_07077 [Thecamonas trahens ATCC 50062]
MLTPGSLVAHALLHDLVPQMAEPDLACVLTLCACTSSSLRLPVSNVTLSGLQYAAPMMPQSCAMVSHLALGLRCTSSLSARTTVGKLRPLAMIADLLSARADTSLVLSASLPAIHPDAFHAPVPGLPQLTIELSVSDSDNLASSRAMAQFQANLEATARATWNGINTLVHILQSLMTPQASMCSQLAAGVDFLHDVEAVA